MLATLSVLQRGATRPMHPRTRAASVASMRACAAGWVYAGRTAHCAASDAWPIRARSDVGALARGEPTGRRTRSHGWRRRDAGARRRCAVLSFKELTRTRMGQAPLAPRDKICAAWGMRLFAYGQHVRRACKCENGVRGHTGVPRCSRECKQQGHLVSTMRDWETGKCRAPLACGPARAWDVRCLVPGNYRRARC